MHKLKIICIIMILLVCPICIYAAENSEYGLKVEGDQFIIGQKAQGVEFLDASNIANLDKGILKEGVVYDLQTVDTDLLENAGASLESLKSNCDSIDSDMSINKDTGSVKGSCLMDGVDTQMEGVKFSKKNGITTFEGGEGTSTVTLDDSTFDLYRSGVLKLDSDNKISDGTKDATLKAGVSERDMKSFIGTTDDLKVSGNWNIGKEEGITEITSLGDSTINGAKVGDKTKLVYGPDGKLKEASIKNLEGDIKTPMKGLGDVTVNGKSSDISLQEGHLTLPKGTRVTIPNAGELGKNVQLNILQDKTVLQSTEKGFIMKSGSYELNGLGVRGNDIQTFFEGYNLPKSYQGNAISFSQGKNPFGENSILKAQASGNIKLSHGRFEDVSIENGDMKGLGGLDMRKPISGDPVLIEVKTDKGYKSFYSDPTWGATAMSTKNSIIKLSDPLDIDYIKRQTITWNVKLAKSTLGNIPTQTIITINPSKKEINDFTKDLCKGDVGKSCNEHVEFVANKDLNAGLVKTDFKAELMLTSDPKTDDKFAALQTFTTKFKVIPGGKKKVQGYGDYIAGAIKKYQNKLDLGVGEADKLADAISTAWKTENGDLRIYIKEQEGYTTFVMRDHNNNRIADVSDVTLKGDKIRTLLKVLGFSY